MKWPSFSYFLESYPNKIHYPKNIGINMISDYERRLQKLTEDGDLQARQHLMIYKTRIGNKLCTEQGDYLCYYKEEPLPKKLNEAREWTLNYARTNGIHNPVTGEIFQEGFYTITLYVYEEGDKERKNRIGYVQWNMKSNRICWLQNYLHKPMSIPQSHCDCGQQIQKHPSTFAQRYGQFRSGRVLSYPGSQTDGTGLEKNLCLEATLPSWQNS